MRNIFLLYCVALAGLCACESEEKVYPDGPGLNEVGMQIVLTDPELNDLLNPESPSFLGEEYTKGILVMYLNAGKKDPLPIRASIHERGRYTERVEHDLSTLRGL